MEKSLRLLIALLLGTGSVLGQVESVTVNGSTRNVINTGVVNFATGQLKVNGVTLPSGGGGSPGGSDTQVQFNDGGAFGGDAGLTYNKTTDALAITGGMSAAGSTFTDDLKTYRSYAPTTGAIFLNAVSGVYIYNNAAVVNLTGLPFESSQGVFLGNGQDTKLDRNAAGVIEVNNGTGGQYRDVIMRTLTLSGTGGTGHVLKQTSAGGAVTSGTLTSSDVGLGNVTNDAQIKSADFPSSSVDGEVVLFSGTSGKVVKRATGSGIVKWTSGVASVVTAPSGTIVGDTDTQTLTNKRVNPRVTSITSNATWSPNADTDDVYKITAQAVAVTTISNPSGTAVSGQKLIIRAKCDSTNRALSGWGSQYRASTDLSFPTTLTANKTMYLGFMYNSDDTKWDLIAKLDNF